MFRFITSHISGSPEPPDAIEEFTGIEEISRSGYPNGVTAIAYDKALSVLALGTKNGHIRLYGHENVEWKAFVPQPIAHLYFAHGSGDLVVLCVDESFHVVRIRGGEARTESVERPPTLKQVTSCALLQKGDLSDTRFLIGTVTGNVYQLNLQTLAISEYIVYEEVVPRALMNQTPRENGKKEEMNETAVHWMSVYPGTPSTTIGPKILLLIQHYTVLIYDPSLNEIRDSFVIPYKCRRVEFAPDGRSFMVVGADGTLATYSTEGQKGIIEQPEVPFGPFPCTEIIKVALTETHNNNGVIRIFTGGMPRASYGDRYTLTVKRDSRTVVFDFSSPVVDFVLIPDSRHIRDDRGSREAVCVFVATDEELVSIDLTDKDWRVLPLLYLNPIHASHITASAACHKVEEHVWKELLKAGEEQLRRSKFSSLAWPVTAGTGLPNDVPCASNEADRRQLYITGHEDGSVKLWKIGQKNLRLLLEIQTKSEFEGIDGADADERPRSIVDAYETDTSEDDGHISAEWPPFRKVGFFDPFCDDDRLSITFVSMDPESGQLLVGGRGGHVLVYHLVDSEQKLTYGASCSPELLDLSKVPSPVRTLRGLIHRRTVHTYPPGYQPFAPEGSHSCVSIQAIPATAVMSASQLPSRQLLSIGTDYGFFVVDLRHAQVIFKKCLLSDEELEESGRFDSALSRFKSMKKSIRQTFRRKKRTNKPNEGEVIEEVKAVERRIEGRNVKEPGVAPISRVRALKFLRVPLAGAGGGAFPGETLWVGTQGGKILALNLVEGETDPSKICQLVAEIRLEHGAPIVALDAVPSSNEKASNRLLLYTEEQIRAFALPSLRSTKYKIKLTATEGSRICKGQLVLLHNKHNRNIGEFFSAVLTNNGKVFVHSLKSRHNFINFDAIKATNVVGISNALLSSSGEIFYQPPGGNEVARLSISAHSHRRPHPFHKMPFPPQQT